MSQMSEFLARVTNVAFMRSPGAGGDRGFSEIFAGLGVVGAFDSLDLKCESCTSSVNEDLSVVVAGFDLVRSSGMPGRLGVGREEDDMK